MFKLFKSIFKISLLPNLNIISFYIYITLKTFIFYIFIFSFNI